MSSISVIIPCYRYATTWSKPSAACWTTRKALTSASSSSTMPPLMKVPRWRARSRQGIVGWRLTARGRSVSACASYSESSSLAIMEAIAAPLPNVTSYVKAPPELSDDSAEGRYSPIDVVGRATDLLVGLVEDESERRAGAPARARFERDYDAAVIAPRLLRLLDESQSTAAGPVSRSEQGVQEGTGRGVVQSQLRSVFKQHRSGHGR
jgi:hypothetical protein